jgi:hypothetical protein
LERGAVLGAVKFWVFTMPAGLQRGQLRVAPVQAICATESCASVQTARISAISHCRPWSPSDRLCQIASIGTASGSNGRSSIVKASDAAAFSARRRGIVAIMSDPLFTIIDTGRWLLRVARRHSTQVVAALRRETPTDFGEKIYNCRRRLVLRIMLCSR